MFAWQAPDREVDALVGGRHDDPFALLGPHETADGLVLRAFVPHAGTVEAIDDDGATIVELSRRNDAGFFEGLVPNRPAWARYRLRAKNAGGDWVLRDRKSVV